jgi:hypothetical protein
MINEEDFTVASLAKLVGSELNTIDRYTEGGGVAGPANKLDPKSFITRNVNVQRTVKNPNVVRHQGMMFHAGVDESLVQSLYPDPVPQASTPQAQQAPQQTVKLSSLPNTTTLPVTDPIMEPKTSAPVYIQQAGASQELIKILQSIDKTLKSIDKTEKTLTKLVTQLTTTDSDKNTSK